MRIPHPQKLAPSCKISASGGNLRGRFFVYEDMKTSFEIQIPVEEVDGSERMNYEDTNINFQTNDFNPDQIIIRVGGKSYHVDKDEFKAMLEKFQIMI